MSGSIREQTAHQHEAARPAGLGAAPALPLLRRPWVVPAAVAGALALALIASGVISIASIAYVAPLAGCLLMHVFMGHGGHGGHGGKAGHGEHQDAAGPQGAGGQQSAAPQHGQGQVGVASDPVCGMRVDPAAARAQGLTSRHGGEDIYFCSPGCKHEFDDDPGRHLSASNAPST